MDLLCLKSRNGSTHHSCVVSFVEVFLVECTNEFRAGHCLSQSGYFLRLLPLCFPENARKLGGFDLQLEATVWNGEEDEAEHAGSV